MAPKISLRKILPNSFDNLLANKRRHPELARIHDQAKEADLLVLDGDGDIIFSTPPRRQTLFLLAMIELGIRLKKRVFLVNSMISDCPLTGRNQKTLAAARSLFARCRAVALRDSSLFNTCKMKYPRLIAPTSLILCLPGAHSTKVEPANLR